MLPRRLALLALPALALLLGGAFLNVLAAPGEGALDPAASAFFGAALVASAPLPEPGAAALLALAPALAPAWARGRGRSSARDRRSSRTPGS
jgi:hypothetical protein